MVAIVCTLKKKASVNEPFSAPSRPPVIRKPAANAAFNAAYRPTAIEALKRFIRWAIPALHLKEIVLLESDASDAIVIAHDDPEPLRRFVWCTKHGCQTGGIAKWSGKTRPVSLGQP